VRTIAWFTVFVASALGCSGQGGHSVGGEKGRCCPNDTCNVGLSCFSNICVRFDGGAAETSATTDAASGGGGGAAGTGASGNAGVAGASGLAGQAGTMATAGAGGAAGAAGAAGSSAGGAGAGGGAGSPAGTSGAGGGPPPACDATTDLSSSDAHCGACGFACAHGRHCVAGRCSPAWLPLSTTGAPAARTRHAAGFVAGKYVVAGGAPTSVGLGMTSAAGYDVATDTWSTLAPLSVARCAHEVVSTGTTLLTFGGCSDCMYGQTALGGLETFTPNASVGA
jgi:hypothetical protein